MKSCYYCDDPGTETVVYGAVRYSFCPYHRRVIDTWLEEERAKQILIVEKAK